MQGSSTEDYDVIVLGLGCAGVATCAELAKRGVDVLGIDKYDIVNKWGSSHGDIRLFRFAYHEGEKYVPLLYESIERWKALEEQTDSLIFESNGSVTIGKQNSTKLAAAKNTCESAEIDHSLFSGQAFSEKYDMWSLPDEYTVLYQEDGGVLHSRNGLKSMADYAQEHSATLHTNTEVISWETTNEGVSVTLDTGEVVKSESLLITAGPWASKIDELQSVLQVERHLVSHLTYESPSFDTQNAPIWIFDGGEDYRFYGAPKSKSSSTVKLGNLNGDTTTSITDFNRDWDYYELLPEVKFARKHFTQMPTTIDGEVCPLTHSPDGDFIIDSSQQYNNVYYGVGLSGHGLKLAPAIGRMLSDCVLTDAVHDDFCLQRF